MGCINNKKKNSDDLNIRSNMSNSKEHSTTLTLKKTKIFLPMYDYKNRKILYVPKLEPISIKSHVISYLLDESTIIKKRQRDFAVVR